MGTQHYFGGAGATEIHSAALLLLFVCGTLLLTLPRRDAPIPFLVAFIFIPFSEQVMVGSMHFTLSRILLLCGYARLLSSRRRLASVRWTLLDKLFLAYCLTSSAMFSLRWGELDAVVNRFGFLYNALGLYFFMRYFICNEEDLDRITKALAGVMLVIAISMMIEQMTGRNLFSVLGGVPEMTAVRDGKLRAQGPFAHPLTAGAVGAVLFPLFFGLGWQTRTDRGIAVLGCIASTGIAVFSMSSTSLITLAGGGLAISMWPLRRSLRWIRRGGVLMLIGLHLVMKAPVWALIARIDLTGSSSSYHRFLLVDQFIQRFGEWWLLGTSNTYNWGWDMWDTINTYVAQGTDGGLLTFSLFITLIWVAFRHLGLARKASASDRVHSHRLWALGSMLFAHTVAFWGIGYFDQSAAIWYSGLAMIAIATGVRRVVPLRSGATPGIALAKPQQSFTDSLTWHHS